MASLFLVLLISAQRPGACFMLIPPSAKATGMAYAWTAIADDASANYYNAAGLAFIDRWSGTVNYSSYLPGLHDGMKHIYIAWVKRLDTKSAIGFDIIYFDTGYRSMYMPEYDGYFSYRITLKVNYARKFSENISTGLGCKLIYDHLMADWVIAKMPELGIESGGTGTSFAFDFNILYKIKPYLSMGLVFHNLGPDISYTESGSSDPLPLLSRLGLAGKLYESEYLSITLSTEMTKILVGMFANSNNSFGENLKYEFKEAWKAIGLEVNYFKMLSLRTGYFYDYEGQRIGWTFGGGIKVLNLEIDIGIDEDVFDFETQNRKLSLTYTF
ncbi:MAG TPA: PorV/PorQ family protein [bacterium]